MAHGEILQIGNPFELYRSPANALVAEFFGSINWIRGTMIGENRVETEIGVLSLADSCRCNGAVIVGIRPEDVRLERSSNDGENRIEGKITSSTFLGDQIVAELKIGERTLTVKAPPDDEEPRRNFLVYLPKEKLVVFPEPVTL
jgi:ABC-type Fe3+/spermidine/putrescine transport system ATPase subunit